MCCRSQFHSRLKSLDVLTVALSLILVFSSGVSGRSETAIPERWSTERAADWQQTNQWLVGCNFITSSAINQLEMWQADTFDLKRIDHELGWAEGIGFNSVRVFLHNLLWTQDAPGFEKRMAKFLQIAAKHHIKVMFVLFDSCWDPSPALGKQRAPKPFVHNSGWVQSPGADYMAHPEKLDELKDYVVGVLGHFRNDARIAFWDLYNEPDNLNDPAYIRLEPAGKQEAARQLLEKTFAWAREANPSQPVSSGVWMGNWGEPAKLSTMERLQLDHSDIITFHNYGPVDEARKCVENLRRYQRPIICTEYMARPVGSTFDPNLSFFKAEKVGAYNWGFVSGKTQTIYPWDSWKKTYTSEPPVWFHDIFRSNGAPYRPEEVAFIRSLTLAKGAKRANNAAPAKELLSR
jgi:hypothetical protein